MDMEQKTKIVLAWELHEQGLTNSRIAQQWALHRGTIGLWIKAIEQQGLLPCLDTYNQAKRLPHPARQVPVSTKLLV